MPVSATMDTLLCPNDQSAIAKTSMSAFCRHHVIPKMDTASIQTHQPSFSADVYQDTPVLVLGKAAVLLTEITLATTGPIIATPTRLALLSS